ncbi:substrate-binding domain-containing protein [Streptomyces sp. ISL-22]|uniref:phosphorylase family protein n=1 Tax=unclassified Streptomyces TaxID=2593676 RepID=UPI001BE9AFAB|nr:MULTISPECIES: VWA domain-containing protein [unclassified Streptomyces]MBT2418575.1 substrate-binding domain-containing protein [Streptomyces sp. ISL-24]MBT2434322.1 substrate-binding domain-containing protein [Streptomyces sp. ISL-22]
MTDTSPTVVILTALRVEYEAVRKLIVNGREVHHDDGTLFFHGHLKNTRWQVALARTGEGNDSAAAVAMQGHQLFRPKAQLFVGIAGSLKDDIRLGDVVVASKVYAIHGARANGTSFQARPTSYLPAYRLLQAALSAEYELRRKQRVHTKPIAAGDVLLDSRDSALRDWIKQHYNDAAAIEMEGAGAAQAGHVAGLDTLIIRGISDLADGGKGASDASGAQERAAANAANFARSVLAKFSRAQGPLPAENKQGNSQGSGAQDGSRRQGGSKTPPPPPPPPPPAQPGRWHKWAAAALAVVVFAGGGWVISSCGRDAEDAGLPRCQEENTTLRIAASVDLSEELRRAAEDYGPRLSGKSCVRVTVFDVNSGTGMERLAEGWGEGDEPHVWSPASSDWLALARARADDKTAGLFPASAPAIVKSPLTIAMPKKMAEALGWPESTVGWKDLAQWAKNSRDFWRDRQQEQWGPLKLGKTNPSYSTSGLNATVGAFYAVTDTSGELSAADLEKPANQDFVRQIEKSAVHYGDTTLTFLKNLRAADDSGGAEAALDYISAVTVEENSVVAYNNGYPCGALSEEEGCARTDRPTTPLVSFYPEDGTPVSDHPYVQLNNMNPAQRKVSADFLAHLHDPEVHHKHFAPYGYRTHENKAPDLVNQGNGALPDTPLKDFYPPQGAVLYRLLEVWPALRRRAHVLVVIDTSTSMNEDVPGSGETKMELLKNAKAALFDEFADTDEVGLWRFSSAPYADDEHHYRQLVPIGPMARPVPGKSADTRREQLTAEVEGLVPDGATGLYGTTIAAVDTMRADYDPSAINAVVLLTDGRNEGVPADPTELQDVLKKVGGAGERVRVFTIAYGSKADEADASGKSVLEQIATTSGGRAYDAREHPETIREVLTSVISNF